MTKTARIVLQDVKFALSKHTDTLQSEWFRISWFGIVGLLRSIGHVLDKVDSQISPAMAYAIRESWKQLQSTKPEPVIFWGFIESERNRILKNYEHGINRTLTIAGPSEPNGKTPVITVDCGNARGGETNPGTPLHSYIANGPYSGRHEKDVAWEAYRWWVTYLDEVDRLAANANNM
ncbi:hypothetical protein IB236_19480 [Acidovorax sp. ACV02]|uniref:hypothetical protein n=1 Tax=Acidovorax sp. ACV02 TaxID=2769310 RepID=UPI00177FC1DA|nr:hypothetical protein [Acidovorax sp. ACV02]MBD9407526.1 hypothetical protein [Acidovorax sp. ACV02]